MCAQCCQFSPNAPMRGFVISARMLARAEASNISSFSSSLVRAADLRRLESDFSSKSASSFR
jgi:hypothetical protein